jgi:hypothetical protein
MGTTTTTASGPRVAAIDGGGSATTAKRLIRELLAGTPGVLRVAGAIGVVAALVFALGGAGAVAQRENALSDASTHTEQLVLLQSVRTALVQADSTATNSFLIGGLGNADDRATYEDNIALASNQIATASAAGSQDAATLSKVNEGLTRYTGLIESARANNRQGFPVGVAFLKQASASLHDEILPLLAELSTTNQQRVDDAYALSGDAAGTLTVVFVISLVALLGVLLALAVKTRRMVNVPVAAALAGIVVVSVIAFAALGYAQWKANDVATGPFRATMSVAGARVDAYDAKSAESLTLISRGSGQAYEAAFTTLADNAEYRLNVAGGGNASFAPLVDFTAYRDIHVQVRALDDAGSWDEAVALSTNGANEAFQTFAASSAATLDAEWKATEDGLSSARAPLTVVQILVLVVGLLAAILVWRGVAVRVREYR